MSLLYCFRRITLTCVRHVAIKTRLSSPPTANLISCQQQSQPLLLQCPLLPILSRSLATGRGNVQKDKKRGKPKVTLSDNELMKVIDIDEFKETTEAVVAGLKEAYITALNIRAGIGLEELQVTYDGDVYPLKELATIAKKGNNLVVLNMTDLPDAIKPVLEAINSSGMNVNPQQEGTIIYLQLPKVTREHRELLAKSAKTLFQKAKEELTKAQNTYIKQAKDKKGQQGISDDLVFNATENIQFKVKGSIAECESLLESKTKELLGE